MYYVSTYLIEAGDPGSCAAQGLNKGFILLEESLGAADNAGRIRTKLRDPDAIKGKMERRQHIKTRDVGKRKPAAFRIGRKGLKVVPPSAADHEEIMGGKRYDLYTAPGPGKKRSHEITVKRQMVRIALRMPDKYIATGPDRERRERKAVCIRKCYRAVFIRSVKEITHTCLLINRCTNWYTKKV